MITLNQTAGNDNALIWIIEIYLGGTYYRYAVKTGVDFVALSNGSEGVPFDGLQLLKTALPSLEIMRRRIQVVEWGASEDSVLRLLRMGH